MTLEELEKEMCKLYSRQMIVGPGCIYLYDEAIQNYFRRNCYMTGIDPIDDNWDKSKASSVISSCLDDDIKFYMSNVRSLEDRSRSRIVKVKKGVTEILFIETEKERKRQAFISKFKDKNSAEISFDKVFK